MPVVPHAVHCPALLASHAEQPTGVVAEQQTPPRHDPDMQLPDEVHMPPTATVGVTVVTTHEPPEAVYPAMQPTHVPEPEAQEVHCDATPEEAQQ